MTSAFHRRYRLKRLRDRALTALGVLAWLTAAAGILWMWSVATAATP